MKRVILIMLILFFLPGEAHAVLVYKDEVEAYFEGKRLYEQHNITFSEQSCEVPPEFNVMELRSINGRYSFAAGVATGVYFYVNNLGNFTYQILKLTDKVCKSECDQYKELFDPPAPDCNFLLEKTSDCRDGEGNVVTTTYSITSSDGRTEFFKIGDDEVQCTTNIDACKNADGSACEPVPFTPTDEPKTTVDDPIGNIPIIIIGGGETGGGTGGETGGGTGGGTGGETGGGTGGTGGETGGGTGGETGGGTGEGTGGEGTGGGGTGGGTGGGGTGDGDGSGFDGNFGTEQGGVEAINKDGWGDSKGEYSLERGQSEHKEYLDSLANKGPLKEIRDHKYITTSGGYCSVNLRLFNRTHVISLCEHQNQINTFGRLLLSLAGLSGLFIILRR